MPCQAHANIELATPLAARLAQRDMHAIAAFANCYAELLSVAFAEMCRTVNEYCLNDFERRQDERKRSARKKKLTGEELERLQRVEERLRQHVPRCGEPVERLYAHAAIRAGVGCLKRHAAGADTPRCLECHTDELLLSDLLLASACLNRDEAAVTYLMDVVKRQVEPSAQRRYGGRLGSASVMDTVSDVISHCWTAAKSRTPPGDGVAAEGSAAVRHAAAEDAAAATAVPGDEPDAQVAVPQHDTRLSHFNGTATLQSWLHGIVEHALLDALRKKKPEPWPTGPGEGCREFEPPDDQRIPDAKRAAADVIRRHFDQVQAVFERRLADLRRECDSKGRAMTRSHVAVLWLKCGARSAEIADALEVSRPAVTQHVAGIRAYLAAEDEEVFEKISREAGCAVDLVQAVLAEGVEHFVRPELAAVLCERFDQLRKTSPDLFHIGFYVLRKDFDEREIGRRTGWKLDVVQRLSRELAQWLDNVVSELAGVLSPQHGVPKEILQRIIAAVIKRGMAEG